MDLSAKDQDRWGSQNSQSFDASIAISAVAALGSLVGGGLAPARVALPLGAAIAGSLAFKLFQTKRQERQRSRPKEADSVAPSSAASATEERSAS